MTFVEALILAFIEGCGIDSTPRRVANARRKFPSVWLGLILIVGFSPCLAAADSLPLPAVNAAAQARVAQLLQEALGPYRPDAEPGETNAAMQQLISLEVLLHEASSLMPERLDLRFGLASALILQAIQTNSQFDLCVGKALAVYREIRALDTNGFDAPLLSAACARASGDN